MLKLNVFFFFPQLLNSFLLVEIESLIIVLTVRRGAILLLRPIFLFLFFIHFSKKSVGPVVADKRATKNAIDRGCDPHSRK